MKASSRLAPTIEPLTQYSKEGPVPNETVLWSPARHVHSRQSFGDDVCPLRYTVRYTGGF